MSWPTSDEAAISTLLGAVIGVAGTYFVQWLHNRQQRRTARMRVANDLRNWMRATASRIYDLMNFESSDGNAGAERIDLPAFRFEELPDQVALLDNRASHKLFELIHLKDTASSAVEFAAEVQGFEDAKNVFRGRAAKLLLDALAIYQDMCRRVGWPTTAFSEHWKSTMQEEVARYQKIEAEEAEFSRKFIDDCMLGRDVPTAATA